MMMNVAKKGDIHRVINGYDDWGNVCGRVTSRETDPKFHGKGGDYTQKRWVRSRNFVLFQNEIFL